MTSILNSICCIFIHFTSVLLLSCIQLSYWNFIFPKGFLPKGINKVNSFHFDSIQFNNAVEELSACQQEKSEIKWDTKCLAGNMIIITVILRMKREAHTGRSATSPAMKVYLMRKPRPSSSSSLVNLIHMKRPVDVTRPGFFPPQKRSISGENPKGPSRISM